MSERVNGSPLPRLLATTPRPAPTTAGARSLFGVIGDNRSADKDERRRGATAPTTVDDEAAEAVPVDVRPRSLSGSAARAL